MRCLQKNIIELVLPCLFIVAAAFIPAAAQTATSAAPSSDPQTIEQLRSKIALRLADADVRRGRVGFKIVSLKTGEVIYEQDAEKYFMPASNMKNITVATALERLTPDHRFITSVYADALPASDGTLAGGLRVYGRGDVSISTAFSGGSYFKGIDDIADAIIAAGVKRIEGDIIADDTYFKGSAIPSSWEWDDLQWYYGAEVSALPINDNAVSLSVTPGPAGFQCSVRFEPRSPVYVVTNKCITTEAGTKRTLGVKKALGRNELEITGTLPVGDTGFRGNVTVSRPAQLFAAYLKERLESKGVTVKGRSRVLESARPDTAPAQTEIAKIESPPLALIAAKTMKPSQNMYTEVLLWTLGEVRRTTLSPDDPMYTADSDDLGKAEVKDFMKRIGVADDGFIQYDGSGLSRHDLVTPDAIVRLYTYMANESRFSVAWRDSLTVAGVDGTLRNRFKNTKAAGNVRGKTGTIDQVSALSGYVTTASGEQLVFSALVNGVTETRERTDLIDDIVLYLAKYNGTID